MRGRNVLLLRRLFKLSGKYVWWYIWLVIAALALSALSIADTEAIRRIVNGATQKDTDLLMNGMLLGIAVLAAGQLIEFLRGYSGELLDFLSVQNLQVGLLSKLTKVLMKSYDKYHTGDLIDRLNNSTTVIQTGVNRTVVNLLQNIITVVFLIGYLSIINVQLTLAAIGFAVFMPIIATPISAKLRALNEQRQKINAEKSAYIQDVLQGSEVVRAFMLHERMAAGLDKIFDSLIRVVRKLIPFENIMNVVYIIVIVAGDFFVLGYGGYLASKGIMTVGDVIAFLLLFERMFGPLSYISTAWPSFQASLAAADRVLEVYDLPEEAESDEASAVPTVGDIAFRNVSFSYSEEEPVLKGLDFTAKRGEVTALVGPSGSGKSTVLKLLMGLYTPTCGEIIYGDFGDNYSTSKGWHNISSFNREEWRNKFSYISQEPNLFSGTIKENLLFGKMTAELSEIKKAVQYANVEELIDKLDKGFDTEMGERGAKLSGGERQRISIARSVLADPEILVMDEPTSSLDNENERKVMNALEILMKGRTTVVVAHRLSTVKNADRIIYIADGTIKETGTHDELMALKGCYYKMYQEAAI